MADLTLERIAELRAMNVPERERELLRWNVELLDAAERGLTGDRKAAAFDRLAAMMRRFYEVQLSEDSDGNAYLRVYPSKGEAICADQFRDLLEAVDGMTQLLKEPTDAQ